MNHPLFTLSLPTLLSFNEALDHDLNYNINSGNFPMELICGTYIYLKQ